MGISTSGILQATNDFAGFFYGSEDALLGGGGNSPYSLPNLAARYDMSNAANYNIGTGIELLSDLSGNSAVNVLALNGVSGNYASTPNAPPLQITGDIDVRVFLSLSTYMPAQNSVFFEKWGTPNNAYSWYLGTNGKITFNVSPDGTTTNAATSSIAVPFSAYQTGWLRATRVSSSGNTNFYTSTDGTTWNQLGIQISTTAGGIFAGTSVLGVGSGSSGSFVIIGNLYRAQIYNGIAGTLVFDANFATAAKLAATFTESSTNAATVTVNTTGDLGARICGARDLVNLTGANQPTVSGGGALFNGTSQYMQAAGFALAQPITLYARIAADDMGFNPRPVRR